MNHQALNIERVGSTSRQRATALKGTLQTALSTHVESGIRRRNTIPTTNIDSPTTAFRVETPPHDPLTTLIAFLSQTNSPISRVQKITARSLISLYQYVKSRNELVRLSSKQFTELLSLLGTLSLSSPRNPCIYLSKLLPHIEESTFEPCWSTVAEIGWTKERLLKTLSGTDRYWIMRAQLAQIVPASKEPIRLHGRMNLTTSLSNHPNLDTCADDPRPCVLSQAKMHYLRIWRHSPDPEIHVPYFEGLLCLPTEKSLSELVLRISKVLELYANPHSRITDLFWKILLEHGRELKAEHKARLLSVVSNRVLKFKPTDINRRAFSAFKIPDGTNKSHNYVALDISGLSSSLGNAVFPTYSPSRAFPPEVHQWASSQASSTFVSTHSPDLRWWSLCLLPICKLSKAPAGAIPALPQVGAGVEWRTVLLLAMLDRTLAGVNVMSTPQSRKDVQDFIRPVWLAWKETEIPNTRRPVNVIRTITATFFRLGAKALDEPLVQGCFRFCVANNLFQVINAENERIQAYDLRLAYVSASIKCGKRNLQEVLSSLQLPGTQWRTELLEGLMRHYISYDVFAAHGIYLSGKEHDVEFSSALIHSMSLALVTSTTWHMSLPFLRHPGFSRDQVQELAGAILSVFREERREYIGPTHAQLLGDTIWGLYAHHAPPKQLKYPIRFFFQIMIASGCPSRAISLVEAIHGRVSDFFTTRLLLRLARTLVRYRHIHLIPRLLRLVPPFPTRGSEDFHRKVTLLVARAGAHARANVVHRMSIRQKVWRTGRESMARNVGFNVRTPSIFHALKIIPILARNPSHIPSIQYAVNILVRAKRSYAAKKLLERSIHLDEKTRTSLGNTLLHGALKQHILRNGRLVRHILRRKESLEKSCGFVPDRVTTNIIIKSVLRWREAITVQKVRALFDHMIRCGYPASPRWCGENGVPFGTPLSSPMFEVPKLPSNISFERHVRPMYKMFVKALYARQDVRGAKIIVGILKEEEVAAMWKREERNRARKEGLIRKWRRERVEKVERQRVVDEMSTELL